MSQAEIQAPSGRPSGTPIWKRAVALAIALLVTGLIIAYRAKFAEFASYGYLGVFVLALVTNATIVLPVPGLFSVFAAGSALNPWLVGLVAGAGMALGELTGYLAGYAGQAVIEDQVQYAKILRWMEGHGPARGFLVIAFLSAIPNPLFDLAGIAAGVLRLSLPGFLLSCWAGKTLKAIVVALGGAYSVGFIEQLLT